MQYTVKALADLSGVTPRTLRWYDREGLVCPARGENGYRYYDTAAVDRLQQVLLYREMDLPLDVIRDLLNQPDFDRKAALRSHIDALKHRREHLTRLIAMVEKNLSAIEGGVTMNDQEKFEAFRKARVDENEQRYGQEARAKYGDAAVNESNRAQLKLSKEDYEAMTTLEEELLTGLEEAVASGADPTGERGQQLAAMHLRWLQYAMGHCDRAMQANLTMMYTEDERFRQHYDRRQAGCAAFLRDATR